jgi:acetyl esterase/lipase
MRPWALRLILTGALAGSVVAGCARSPADTRAVDRAPSAPTVIPDVVYGHKSGMALTFDVFRPAQPNGAGVIFINSGGYRSPFHRFHVETEDGFRLMTAPEQDALGPAGRSYRLRALVERGFTVFNVRHGSSPRFLLPEIVTDVRRAVRVIRDTAADYDVDPDRLGLFGGSAGGHLSLLVGVTSEVTVPEPVDDLDQLPAPVAAIVAYYPPSDYTNVRPQSVERFPALDFPAELRRSHSPSFFASPDDPPTLIIHGDEDTLVALRHGQSMHEALREQGVTTELVVMAGAGHGFRDEDSDRAMALVIDWFEQYLLR